MKMKWITIAAVVAMFAMRADAFTPFTVSILFDRTNVVLTVNERPVSVERLKESIARVGRLDTGQFVLVRVQTSVPAERLLAVLKMIKDSGLKSVCVLPLDGTGVGILSLEIHPKTNEFIHVKEDVPDLEPVIEMEMNAGRTNAYTLRGAPPTPLIVRIAYLEEHKKPFAENQEVAGFNTFLNPVNVWRFFGNPPGLFPFFEGI